jgi:GntR family transcriptional regulator, transcriptional repressor for pyruvate dehydrogenase complex
MKLEPLQTRSLKELFVDRFERLILSGELAIGQKLPSERELALQLGVSRPVVHGGLAQLEARGLVQLKPRSGAVVTDYRRSGSLALLNSLINYHRGVLEPSLLLGMLEMRQLVEVEAVRLAANRRGDEDLERLVRLVDAEAAADPEDWQRVTDLDFDVHHGVALASGNAIYPLFIKSCEPAYKNLSGQFFTESSVVPRVIAYHRELIEALQQRDERGAVGVMRRLLQHGRDVLGDVLSAPAQDEGRGSHHGRP